MVHDIIAQAAYMAHGYCLLWKPWLVSLHAGSDLLIALAYLAIPFAIFQIQRRRTSADFRPIGWLFVAFIFLCGMTHIVNLLTLWFPIYETQGVIKLATALVSVATAVAMFPLVPVIAAMPDPRQLQDEITAHRATLAELENARCELERRVLARTEALSLAKQRFESLVIGSSQAVWVMAPDGSAMEDSPSWRRMTDQSRDEWLGFGWLDAIHPADRPRVEAIWTAAAETRSLYRAEYRVRTADGWLWTEARAVPLFDDAGQLIEWVGMNHDISERKRGEETMALTLRELSHRTKNLLAVIGAMTRQSIRPEASTADYVRGLGERLQAMARSHDLLVQSDWQGARLGELVSTQLSAFDGDGIAMGGPDIMLSPAATQAIGMALFELATNAAKYGALAEAGGSLEICWTLTDGHLHLAWTEAPAAAFAPVDHRGFGHTVVTRMVRDALDAEVTYDIGATGVRWTVIAPFNSVCPDPDGPPTTLPPVV